MWTFSPPLREPDLSSLPTLSPEALERLVYLVGPARGGTSIINEAIGIHPDILGLPNMSHFVNNVWNHRTKVNARVFQAIFRLPGYFDLPQLLETLAVERAATLKRHVVRTLNAKKKNFRQLYQLYPLLYAMTARNHKDPSHIVCWHDKSNDWRNIRPVARHFPEARFIFVTRDPRGSTVSYADRMTKKTVRDVTAGRDIDDVIDGVVYWRIMMEQFRAFARRRPGRSLLVRFEDFMQKPESTLNRIFEFALGSPLPDDVVRQGLARLGGGATNDPNELYRGISSAPLERWKDHLSEDEVALIAAIAGDTAGKLGYPIEPAASATTILRVARRLSGVRRKTMFGAKMLYANAVPFIA